MSYSNLYFLDCDTDTIAFDPEQHNEYGRVRSVAFIRKAYLQQILADPENLTKWTDGINSGDVIILERTAGSYDSGNPLKLKGYGKRLSTHGYRDMRLTFNVCCNKINYDFFNDLDKRTDYVPAFRTGSYMHIFASPADIMTKEEAQDDIESTVLWTIDCTVRNRDLPIKIDSSNLMTLFTCRDCSLTVFSDAFSCAFL
jgi:hypothetical protein